MELIVKSCPYMKDIWDHETARCEEFIHMGMCRKTAAEEILSEIDFGKEEYALKSQHMDRGFYCPSPIREHIVENAHRGKIAKRMSRVLHPTHYYRFDKADRLRYTETYYPNGSVKSEYIFYTDNVTYGVVYPTPQRCGEIILSEYDDGRICSYIWASWKLCGDKCIFDRIDLEKYYYDQEGYIIADWYDMNGMTGQYTKWRLSRDNEGAIVHNSLEKLNGETGCLLGSGGTVTLNYNLLDRTITATVNSE